MGIEHEHSSRIFAGRTGFVLRAWHEPESGKLRVPTWVQLISPVFRPFGHRSRNAGLRLLSFSWSLRLFFWSRFSSPILNPSLWF